MESTVNQRVVGSSPTSGANESHYLWLLSFMANWCVYILQSVKDDSYYIGCTDDLDRSISEHNPGLSKYTSKKMPWNIKYVESVENLIEARKREAFLKRQKNRKFYEKIINAQLVTPSTRGDC